MRAPRYPSDTTEDQWARVSTVFDTEPGPGRPRTTSSRDMLDAILYVMKQGCAWRALPCDFPPWRTVYRQRWRWTLDGTLARALAALQPVRHGEDYQPSVGIIDATFVESAYGGGRGGRSGYKRATGHCVSVLIDTESYVLSCGILAANRPDAEIAFSMLPQAKAAFPSLQLILGDKAYRWASLAKAAAEVSLTVDADSPALPRGVSFEPMPLRWRVERFFAWFSSWRRVAKNWCRRLSGFVMDVSWVLLGMALRRSGSMKPSRPKFAE